MVDLKFNKYVTCPGFSRVGEGGIPLSDAVGNLASAEVKYKSDIAVTVSLSIVLTFTHRSGRHGYNSELISGVS